MFKIVSDYFHFTKKERIAIIFFSGLLLASLVYRISLSFHTNPILQIDLVNLPLPVDSTTTPIAQHRVSTKAYTNHNHKLPINPNNASFSELSAIGFSTKQAATIINYRKKGGTFNFREDLLKVYGVDSATYTIIAYWIALPHKSTITTNGQIESKKIEINTKKQIEINEADSTMLISVYGIGPYLAHQIIKYRTNLGGFISLEQLQEVKGMHLENFKSLTGSFYINSQPKKININSTEIRPLAIHPYSDWSLASSIINYRKQHGPFKQLSDLFNIYGINETKLSKLKPYLYIE